MSSDIFVTFPRKPTKEQIRKALEGYLNGAAIVSWETDRWIVLFPQGSSSPLSLIDPKWAFITQKERWFEVYLGPGTFSVITRQQDEFVYALAKGFAEFSARYWKGKIKDM